MLNNTLPRFGITTTFVDPDDVDNFAKAVKPNTRAFFAESLGNPKLDVLDLEGISAQAKAAKVPFIVDNTIATPALLNPIAYGANIVIHSLTKYITGNGTTIGGIIIDAGTFDYSNGNFPEFTEPSPSYHGLKYHDVLGPIAFIARVRIEANKIKQFNIIDPGSGYAASPTITVYDPEETGAPYFSSTISIAVLPQPIFYNRGTGYQSALVAITGDGYAEELQIGNTMTVSGLNIVPGPGANFRITGQDDTIYRLVKVTKQSGVSPNIQITFQVSPVITRSTAPAHGTTETICLLYTSDAADE